MCWILIGLISNLPLPGGQIPLCVIRLAHTLLNFLYIAQFPSQTMDTLHHLDESLMLFHQNKSIFANLGVRAHFNVLKLHSLFHYQSSITLFGTTDNYNTKQLEHLQINFAQAPYHATNHKIEYLQMTQWLKSRENLH